MKAISISLEVRNARFFLSLKAGKINIVKMQILIHVFSVVMVFTLNLSRYIFQMVQKIPVKIQRQNETQRQIYTITLISYHIKHSQQDMKNVSSIFCTYESTHVQKILNSGITYVLSVRANLYQYIWKIDKMCSCGKGLGEQSPKLLVHLKCNHSCPIYTS